MGITFLDSNFIQNARRSLLRDSPNDLIIAGQEISATFKQYICDMQFNAVAVALKSRIAMIWPDRRLFWSSTETFGSEIGEPLYAVLEASASHGLWNEQINKKDPPQDALGGDQIPQVFL